MSDPVSTQGFYQVGAGNDIARMDGVDPLWRIWVGNTDPTLAPFAVRKDGFVKMTSACISGGSITVLSGSLSASRIISDWIPEHSGSHDMGAAGSRWDVLYAVTGCFSGSVNIDGNLYTGSLLTVGADYVFEDTYELFPLEHLSNYLSVYHALPTMDGIQKSLNDIVLALWETVEAQALYISELHNRVRNLERLR